MAKDFPADEATRSEMGFGPAPEVRLVGGSGAVAGEPSVVAMSGLMGVTDPAQHQVLRRAEAADQDVVAIEGRVFSVGDALGWCLFEAMGNRRVAGECWRTEGGNYLVRIPLPGGGAMAQVYGEGALYCLTPCSEDRARHYLNEEESLLPQMVQERVRAAAEGWPRPSLSDSEDLPF